MPERVEIKLTSSYPLERLERMVRDLAPLLALTKPTVVRIDLQGLVWIGPSCGAYLTAVLREVSARGYNAKGSSIVYPARKHLKLYLQRMDIMRLVVGDASEEDFERHETVGFRPCTAFDSHDGAHEVAAALYTVVHDTCDLDGVASGSIYTSVDELCENVVYHAATPRGGVAAGQGWPKKSVVEIGIADLGIGILGSLRSNERWAELDDDVIAIETALESGVTSSPNRNSGVGLFFTELLLRANGGRLVIRSGHGRVERGGTPSAQRVEHHLPGTLVVLQLNTDRALNMPSLYRLVRRGDDVDDPTDPADA